MKLNTTGRLLLAVAVLLALAAAMWSLPRPTGRGGDTGLHHVEILGPGAQVGWVGTAQASDGTVLGLLFDAARQGGFAVDVEELPGFGADACSGSYVRGIGEWRETASGGWNYYLRAEAGQEWRWGSKAAACHALAPGEQVQWRWVEGEA